MICKLQADKVSLKCHNLGNDALSLTLFSDASLGNLSDGSTQGGDFDHPHGENRMFSPLSLAIWLSNKAILFIK